MKTIPYSEFKDNVRRAILDALDANMEAQTGMATLLGWVDGELPVLFAGVDAHIVSLASRINGVADITIDMEK